MLNLSVIKLILLDEDAEGGTPPSDTTGVLWDGTTDLLYWDGTTDDVDWD